MNLLARLATRIYPRLARCYPREFRDEFGVEMEAVFATAVSESQKSGLVQLLKLAGREFRQWPASVLDAHLQERRGKMYHPTGLENDRPLKWTELLAALTIFLLPPFAYMMDSIAGIRLANAWSLSILGIALALAILKGLPRWSPPYLGVLLIWFFYLGPYRTIWSVWEWISANGVQLTGDPFSWSPLARGLGLGLMATILWVLILSSALLLANLLRLLPFTRGLWQRIRLDWTQLSFVIYGGVILNIIVLFEEYRGDEPWQILAWGILAVGCWLYLHSKGVRQRILFLVGGVTLAMWVVAVGKWVLVPIQDWGPYFRNHPPETERWFEFWWTLAEWAGIVLVMLAPALLKFLLGPPKINPQDGPNTELNRGIVERG